MTYKGIRVKTSENVNIGEPLGIETPTFDVEQGQMYTLQWKHCNKTPHDILNYIYVGEQNLGSIDLTTFKTVDIVEDYQEKLCFVEFVCNKTLKGTTAKIGRIQDSKDTPNTECFLIREAQIEKGSMTDYKPNYGDDVVQWDKVQTQINQNASKIDLMAKKTELDAYGNKLSNAMASIAIQAGLIENKVEQGDLSTLIRQSPIDIQYAFNGINPRYIYTNDGFYMKADNGNNKAAMKRGSFYLYNYKGGSFLGGFTPIIFEGWDNAGQGIINAKESYFFTIAKDNTLENDTQDFATNLSSFFTINFRDRSGGSGNAYKYGAQIFTPLYVHDNADFNDKDIKNVKDLYALTGSFTSIWDMFGNKCFEFNQSTANNYRHWDWGGMNLTNCNWVGSYTQPSTNMMFLKYKLPSLLDSIEVINTQTGKLGLAKIPSPFLCLKSSLDNIETPTSTKETFEYEQIIFSLVKEVKELKEEIRLMKEGV